MNKHTTVHKSFGITMTVNGIRRYQGKMLPKDWHLSLFNITKCDLKKGTWTAYKIHTLCIHSKRYRNA